MTQFNLSLLQPITSDASGGRASASDKTNAEAASTQGLLTALTILAVWASSLIFLLKLDTRGIHPVILIMAMLAQMFLYTGLFITAHDAMHGVVFPKNLRINNLVGSIALLVYGLFSYKKLLRKHWLHHHHPASDLDPDFHDGSHKNFFAWYLHFMQGYWSWWRLLGLMGMYHAMHLVLHIPETNLVLFWVIPSIASSLQLFYFGTYRPHQEPPEGYSNPYRAQTFALPTFWSFITCYHFGYHKEHHEFPHVPWWRLPAIYQPNL